MVKSRYEVLDKYKAIEEVCQMLEPVDPNQNPGMTVNEVYEIYCSICKRKKVEPINIRSFSKEMFHKLFKENSIKISSKLLYFVRWKSKRVDELPDEIDFDNVELTF
jgi:hypothetical protein